VSFPDPILRAKAKPIETIDSHVREVAARMIELMHEAEGIGLAAPQVGLPWRMFVSYVPEDDARSVGDDPPSATAEPQVFVNPELFDLGGEMEPLEEGCLSLFEIRGEVLRPRFASLRAVDLSGEALTRHAQGLLARCWQHENDHLDGVLIIDRMTQMSRLKVRSTVRALERQSLKS
jgi:peptide deformylase